MKLEVAQKVARITLPDRCTLYSSGGLGLVRALREYFETLHKTGGAGLKGVILIQDNPLHDYDAGWLADLSGNILFHEHSYRLDDVRWLLYLVRHAPVPVFFVSGFSCLGSAFELALSCSFRYWFSQSAMVGFPEIGAGVFPPGGVVESLYHRQGLGREKWQSRPVARADLAAEHGLIDFCSDFGGGPDGWLKFVLETMGKRKFSAIPSSSGRRRREIPEFSRLAESRATAYEQIEHAWRQEGEQIRGSHEPWNFAWRLVAQRKRFKSDLELGRTVCLLAARHFLSPRYRNWLAAAVSARPSLPPPVPVSGPHLPVFIDLDYVTPPTAVLHRILLRGRKVIFFAAESRSLASALGLIYSRMEREVRSRETLQLWQEHVSFMEGDVRIPDLPLLRFTVDDRLTVIVDGRELSFLRLDGNASNAAVGELEAASANDETLAAQPSMRSLIGDLTDTCHVVTHRYGNLPWSLAVRSMFFEEMLRYAGFLNGDLARVAGLLKSAGWAYAGDEDAWDRFLKSRYVSYSIDKESLDRLSPGAGERLNWEIGSWKHGRALARKHFEKTPPSSLMNPALVSRHFAYFTGIIVLLNTQPVGTGVSDQELDHLALVATGFPPELGSPAFYLHERGARRVMHHWQKYWPHTIDENSRKGLERICNGWFLSGASAPGRESLG